MKFIDWCNANNANLIYEYTGKCIDGTSYNIDELSYQSNKKLLWICKNNNNHTWYTSVQKRTVCKSGCPYCSSQQIDNTNSLYKWCIDNNKEQLIKEFVGLDENNNYIDITRIAPMSHKRVVWEHTTLCGDIHKWTARISDRTSHNSKCPLCYGRNNLKDNNDLYTWCINNGKTGDDIIASWIGKDIDNNDVDIHKIAKSSHKKVKLRCIYCNNIWESSILHMTYNKKIMCNMCKHKYSMSKKNKTILDKSLTLLEWANLSEINKEILNQFVGEDIDENIIDPNNISYGSNKKVKWRHLTNNNEVHEWYAAVHNRTCNMSGCPFCYNGGTSLPEQVIYRCIKQIYPNTIHRGKYKGYEFDITIPELKTCIEYGSTYYHSGREKRDNEKKKLCNKYNVRLITIIDDSNNQLTKTFTKGMIIRRVNIHNLEQLVKDIFIMLNIDYTIDYNKAYKDAFDFISKY